MLNATGVANVKHCTTYLIMFKRYTWRHDSILNNIHKTDKDSLTADTELDADISADFQGASTIPTVVAIIIQRLHIVTVKKNQHKVIIHFELSLPFEINIDDTHYRKVERYAKLISNIENNGYEVIYYPVEIDARECISNENQSTLKPFLRQTSQQIKF